MAKKVLIICEGVDKEPKIFARVKALGFLPQDVEVVSYGTINVWKEKAKGMKMDGIRWIYS